MLVLSNVVFDYFFLRITLKPSPVTRRDEVFFDGSLAAWLIFLVTFFLETLALPAIGFFFLAPAALPDFLSFLGPV